MIAVRDERLTPALMWATPPSIRNVCLAGNRANISSELSVKPICLLTVLSAVLSNTCLRDVRPTSLSLNQ
ncbi:unnamed protein product [Oppiella nova]|uniref:Uncharacterized protein n=1 Tax=Oppiella nova TaxID=334625 RepID=A0A7R9QNM7_9ACAR|nr:unnamed protein product [Oppiella nova]CAG2169740.1 unnamed protein product [Oppiella nova]